MMILWSRGLEDNVEDIVVAILLNRNEHGFESSNCIFIFHYFFPSFLVVEHDLGFKSEVGTCQCRKNAPFAYFYHGIFGIRGIDNHQL
ncbi:hypothetical protein L6452_43540 [Arctium lappa]|uniref:Uncharacterized protein n=1 Tax=Arctium lappa TaxID=4217 RepID=A0ACB8XCT2_ARCLA|nr:hypothetical protein L6452_43540 [Arctium lappa]